MPHRRQEFPCRPEPPFCRPGDEVRPLPDPDGPLLLPERPGCERTSESWPATPVESCRHAFFSVRSERNVRQKRCGRCAGPAAILQELPNGRPVRPGGGGGGVPHLHISTESLNRAGFIPPAYDILATFRCVSNSGRSGRSMTECFGGPNRCSNPCHVLCQSRAGFLHRRSEQVGLPFCGPSVDPRLRATA